MPITLRDFFTFPFNGGKGIKKNQVDWSVDDSDLDDLIQQQSVKVLYSFDLAYNAATDEYHGTFTPVTSSAPIGALVAFETPDTLPSNDLAAVVVLPVDGAETEFDVLDSGLNALLNSGLAPKTLYWARVYSGLSLVILSSSSVGAISRQVNRTISNAELKTLDTDYIELIGVPGAGKFIEPQSITLTKNGSDAPTTTQRFYTAVSADDTLTAVEAAAGVSTLVDPSTLRSFGSSGIPLPSFSTDSHLFIGTEVGFPSIVPTHIDINGEVQGSNRGVGSGWEEVAGTLTVNSVETQWVKLTISEAGGQDDTEIWTDNYSEGAVWGYLTGGASVDELEEYAQLAIIIDDTDPTLSNPLEASDTGTSFRPLPPSLEGLSLIYNPELKDVLALSAGGGQVQTFGGQSLQENKALTIGLFIATDRYGTHLEAVYDSYLESVDDVTIDVKVTYSIHSA